MGRNPPPATPRSGMWLSGWLITAIGVLAVLAVELWAVAKLIDVIACSWADAFDIARWMVDYRKKKAGKVQ